MNKYIKTRNFSHYFHEKYFKLCGGWETSGDRFIGHVYIIYYRCNIFIIQQEQLFNNVNPVCVPQS